MALHVLTCENPGEARYELVAEEREKLDPIQASSVDFAVAHEGNFYIKGEAGTGKFVVLAHIAAKYKADNPKVFFQK